MGSRFVATASVSKLAAEERLAHAKLTNGREGAVVMIDRRFLAESEPDIERVHRWGLVLAGGDGLRVRELTRFVCRDDRPKQFCPLLGKRTLLQQARRRAERSIPAEQILYSLTAAHHPYSHQELGDRPAQRVVQPCNKGTAPAILSALVHLSHIDPNAIVAILPCDHYYSRESLIAETLDLAFDAATAHPESVVVVGAPPRAPEVDYGWIVPGNRVRGRLPGVFEVQGFWEKPSFAVAQNLFRNKSLWNTFVMTGHVQAFLDMAAASVPGLIAAFRSSPPAGSPAGVHIADSLYRAIEPVDFAHSILSPEAKRLATVRLADTAWDDLGSPQRVMAALLQGGMELPAWAARWRAKTELGLSPGRVMVMSGGRTAK